ncbi:hypothetical protein CAPTEDRAFT_135432 [Capitella teleta]|uniref:Serine/threonine-protein phosphatase 4 regulatory subunit 2 n=1 Tax=Capitella teleta TaxID=283909 RepID=R7TSH7_CAPTE|nr:hypothetical protein CAPTEDRAFT_135432 [Capitella teleta]|eukprot:ELT96562.1 hypothetical protein CAPTEDRAFT_135432 [Capitella teleta]
MENKEDVLNALEDFIKKPSETIPEILESYLKHIAKTGTTVFPWGKLKPLFEQRLSQAISEFHERFPMDKSNVVSANVESLSFDVMRDRILEAIKTFSGAPFTIQRLCELITTPGKHYRSTAKYLRGIEKNIMVVSTVDPFGRYVHILIMCLRH